MREDNSRKDKVIIQQMEKDCNPKATQKEKIVDYINVHGSIDPWRAMRDLRVMRLASRVYELRAAGVPIIGEMIIRESEDGRITKWKEYRLATR